MDFYLGISLSGFHIETPSLFNLKAVLRNDSRLVAPSVSLILGRDIEIAFEELSFISQLLGEASKSHFPV